MDANDLKLESFKDAPGQNRFRQETVKKVPQSRNDIYGVSGDHDHDNELDFERDHNGHDQTLNHDDEEFQHEDDDDLPAGGLLRKGTTQIFDVDAQNDLSYSKMMMVVDQNHPRLEIEGRGGKKEYQQRPFCKTKTGWHCCCRPCRQSDIHQYGIGITLYFKMLKFLVILFTMASIINIPMFVLYSAGGGTNDQTAYMGENSMACNFDQVVKANDMAVDFYLSCEQGVLCDLKGFGQDYARDNETSISSCNKDKNIYYDNACNMSEFDKSYFDYTIQTYKNSCQDKQTFDSGILTKDKVAIIIAIFDVIFAVLLGVSLIIYKCLMKIENIEIKGVTINAANFTVQLSGIPEHQNVHHMKGEIWEWTENQLKRLDDENDDDPNDKTSPVNNPKVDQEDKRLQSFEADGVDENSKVIPRVIRDVALNNQSENDPRAEKAKKNRIVDITMGLNDYDYIIHLCYLNLFYKQIKLNMLRLPKIQSPQIKANIEKQIEGLKLKIKARLETYDLWMKNNMQLGLCAFIQFRSMIDMIRFLSGFGLSVPDKLCFKCRKNRPSVKAKLFFGKLPVMLTAPDPANLLWVNLRYSKCNTFWRRFLIAIVSIILMAGSFIAIIYAKDFEKQVQLRYNMNMDCGTLTYTQAQVIYQEQQALIQTSTSFNYLHCYCLQQFKSVGNMFVYVIAFIIVACNILVKGILRYITYFEKPKTVGIRSFSVMIKIFLIQFVNTVMILILVNWRIDRTYDFELNGKLYKIPKPIFGDNFVIFSGRYTDFTPEFYRTVGTTLLLTMIINIVSPNFINFGFYLVKKISQCCDRRCTTDLRKTKMIIQEDYEALYMGPELQFEGRYATLLTTFYACLFLSFGMPLFYVVGFLSFLFTYWIDKYLFGVFFHLVIAFMMISNNLLFGKVCGLPDFDGFKASVTATVLQIPFIDIIFDSKRFEATHSILLFVVMFVAVTLILLLVVLGTFLYSCYQSCKKTCNCNCFKKLATSCTACLSKCCNITACFKKCISSCTAFCKGKCAQTSCCSKICCCCSGNLDIMEGIRPLLDLKNIVSLDFYKEISIFELRLLYIRTNYELEMLEASLNGKLKLGVNDNFDAKLNIKFDASIGMNADGSLPQGFVRMREYMKFRQAAIELEIKNRLLDLQIKAKIPGEIDLNTQIGIIKGLEAALKIKGGLIHLKRLSGLFSYDIKFSPEYTHCLKMKEKLPELRKLIGQQ
ncbi:UNKNOWN [Stylonychia lemnae]|uniref:Uncharacterized protein n=1 Tax=Stylonychia lemnae TaxID=5949 RepID=A0A078ALA2_STYLE|nr:UNKNOWN [Stylonychia lemnae]|eukprot:CDW82979.1 UNKNOWN [Stylonychia lemnae]